MKHRKVTVHYYEQSPFCTGGVIRYNYTTKNKVDGFEPACFQIMVTGLFTSKGTFIPPYSMTKITDGWENEYNEI